MKIFYFACLLTLFMGCEQETRPETSEAGQDSTAYGNPAAEGFNAEGSSEEAVAIADEVMESMGGRKAWDDTRFLEWTFFGRRKLLWDKQEGRVRIDFMNQPLTIVTNIDGEPEGKVWMDSTLVENADTLNKYLKQGRSIWINDAYWLVMPYKLKDSGVTLNYLREDTLQSGEAAEVLELTFENVGDTPQNRYEVWVSQDEKRVRQWAYYPTAEADTPRFVTPWDDYEKYGNIYLSGERGMAQLTDIAVHEEVADSRFTNLQSQD